MKGSSSPSSDHNNYRTDLSDYKASPPHLSPAPSSSRLMSPSSCGEDIGTPSPSPSTNSVSSATSSVRTLALSNRWGSWRICNKEFPAHRAFLSSKAYSVNYIISRQIPGFRTPTWAKVIRSWQE